MTFGAALKARDLEGLFHGVSWTFHSIPGILKETPGYLTFIF